VEARILRHMSLEVVEVRHRSAGRSSSGFLRHRSNRCWLGFEECRAVRVQHSCLHRCCSKVVRCSDQDERPSLCHRRVDDRLCDGDVL
jgi:hypothetical protein